MEIKKGDVYSFRYNAETLSKMSSPYWCFDGILEVRQGVTELILEDTYWGGTENRYFTLEKALKEGTLEFICNLDEVEETKESSIKYYSSNDIFVLPRHGGYRTIYLLRKGATRSKDKMLESIKDLIAKSEREKKWLENDIERYQNTLKEIESGNLEVYI